MAHFFGVCFALLAGRRNPLKSSLISFGAGSAASVFRSMPLLAESHLIAPSMCSGSRTRSNGMRRSHHEQALLSQELSMSTTLRVGCSPLKLVDHHSSL